MIKRATELSGLDIGENQTISVTFVGPRSIAQINGDYVGHQGVTDVISFCYIEDGDLDEDDTAVDLVICVDVAILEGAEREDSSYAEELILYIVHGLLHASGEDDLEEEPRKQMRIRENEVMTELKKEFVFSDIIMLESK